MNGDRIHHILSLDPYTKLMYKGFCSPDLPLPSLDSLPAFIVLNTGPSWTLGEHWCVACFEKDICYFFDSYGRSPSVYGFVQSLIKKQTKIVFNEKKVQGVQAKTCGHHCLYFAMNYARGIRPEEIMKTYEWNNIRKNDNMVFDYLKRTCGSIMSRISE